MYPWTDKYMPQKLSDIRRQSTGPLLNFITNFNKQDKKAMLIHGPTGNGKTAAVYAVANEHDLELIELNASDKRNADAILDIAGNAAVQASLFGKKKVILIDEVDGIYGRTDRGAVSSIIKVIKKTKFPIVLTANDPWDPKLRPLRRHVEMLRFKRLSSRDIVAILKHICEVESVSYDLVVLKEIADSAQGDARSAINDLQAVAGDNKVTLEDLEALAYRKKQSDIFEAMKIIFKGSPADAYKALNTDKDFGMLLLWIEENIATEYEKPEEIAQAYDFVSRADVFLGRIRRWQHYRFQYYASILATAGVSASKKERYRKWSRYQPPTKIMKLSRTKRMRAADKAIAEKVATHCHTSTRLAVQQYLPLLKTMLKKHKDVPASLRLDKDDIKHLSP